MPRIVEIVLVLTPFLAFAAWRLLFPMVPSLWLIGGLAGFVAVMLIALIWVRHFDAQDANQPYLPDKLRDGRIVPAQPPARP